MNENNNTPYNNFSAPQQSGNKSKLILVIVIVAVVVLLGAIGGYAALASANKWWPFSATTTEEPKKDEPALSIKKVGVTMTNGKKIFDIALALNTKEDGYCVLNISSKTARLEIDDSKVKTQPKNAAPLKQCQGWSLDANTLPKGDYTIDVKFVGEKNTLTASEKVTLTSSRSLD